MRTSNAGIDLIAKFEGFRSLPYNDPVGHCTVGYGHLIHRGNCTQSDRNEWGTLTPAEGLELLRSDVRHFERAVESLVNVPLTQHQFDALVSFAFNLGAGALGGSTLLKYINRKRWESAAREFGKWVYADGQKLEGLVRRRREEEALFRSGTSGKCRRWNERLERDRRIANARREAGKEPWPLWLRTRARARKALFERYC